MGRLADRMIEVVDSEDQMWILFRDSDRLLFDANCNHSAFGYSFLIELKHHETEAYQQRGREYLNDLWRVIQDSAPVVRGSTSPFKGRDLSKELGDATTVAFHDWKSQRNHQAEQDVDLNT